MPLSAGDKLGPYEVLAPIGAGGMGEVYRARDSKLNRDVAIKVLPAAFANDVQYMARFEREARVLASLNHPNIATVYGIEQGALVMELVEGDDLRGPLPLEEALPIARQIAMGLEAAHERGIVHRDLKPANIKITGPASGHPGAVKILDFGLAKSAEDFAAPGPKGHPGASPTMSPTLSLAMTQAGMILGTAAYMSPEQARGKPVDKRADIWAFGVVLYEMLTGRQLFGGGETITDTLASVVKDTPDLDKLPAETPPHIRRLLRRCLTKDLQMRLRDIGEARIALVAEGSEPAQDAAPHAAVPPGISRWWGILAAVFAAAAVALAVVHFREKPPAAETWRFQVAPPEQWAFSSASPTNGIALSPDGRQLAFIGAQGGRVALWVHAFESGSARELPGTENAGGPFWSPDGRSIGFLTPGKLKRIDLAGGPPVAVCDVHATGTGGSWSRNGVILFGTNNGPIFRVAQAGGIATPLTKLDTSRNESFHSRPWFLPDGERFLYLARSAGAGTGGIYLASLQGGERQHLVDANEAAEYAAPPPGEEKGHLLFLREGTLMALPLDARSFQPTGDPFPVAEKVGAAISNAFFSVSRTGVLAYHATGYTGQSQLQWFDPDGKQLGSLGPHGVAMETALSPDGKRLAISQVLNNSGYQNIWLLDTDRGVPSRFTFDDGLDRRPVWSPDGKTVAFSSVRNQNGGYSNLYTKDAGGGGSEQLLLKTDANKLLWDWSGDGRFLLYGVTDPNPQGQYDLWALPLEGDRKPFPYLTSRFFQQQARFSPGPAGAPRWVAYVSNESGRAEVYVQAFPAAEGGKFQISGEGGVYPVWRRDGRELYYIADDGKLMAVDVTLAPRFEHGVPKALFAARVYGGVSGVARVASPWGLMYAPSVDGKRFLINTQVQDAAPVPITVVLNWTAGLNRP